MAIIIQEDSFSISKICAELSDEDNVGAIVSFSGHVREFVKDKQLKYLEIEHYPGMTEKALEDIEKKAMKNWGVTEIMIVHRVGRLLPKDLIVGVIVSSMHRSNAFKACEFVIDFLKTDAPFWKKEISEDSENWVDERQEDIIKKTSWN